MLSDVERMEQMIGLGVGLHQRRRQARRREHLLSLVDRVADDPKRAGSDVELQRGGHHRGPLQARTAPPRSWNEF